MTCRWLVVVTAPRSECRARWEMQAAGLEAWYPMGKRRLHRKGGGHACKAVFPRYVFVQAVTPWFGVSQFKHVQEVLTNNNTVLLVADQVIEEIRKRQASGEFDEKAAPKQRRPRANSFRDLKKMLDAVDRPLAA